MKEGLEAYLESAVLMARTESAGVFFTSRPAVARVLIFKISSGTKEFYVFETLRPEKNQCCISILVTQVS